MRWRGALHLRTIPLYLAGRKEAIDMARLQPFVSRSFWHTAGVDMGRRRAIFELAGLAIVALGASNGVEAQTRGGCILTPDAGDGPFYLYPGLIRSDITAGKPGAPLDLALQVVRAGDCATLRNARVDVWHADALGLYSGYAQQSGVGGVSPQTVVGKQDLRGTQFTDADGSIRFRTVFPSWYGGRTPHVHFKVFLNGNQVVASQVFFPDEVNNEVFTTWDPYRQHVSKRTTFNSNDPIRQGVFSDVTRSGSSFSAKAVLVVAPRS
jgi:protocatechuate 3,4-dioxygenase beta subunit